MYKTGSSKEELCLSIQVCIDLVLGRELASKLMGTCSCGESSSDALPATSA
jgi:hypothetical protein